MEFSFLRFQSLNYRMSPSSSGPISIAKTFSERFAGEPILIRSPGRINLIGEHTDYNSGFVLPAAIDKAVYVAVRKNETEKIRLYSAKFNESFEISINELKPTNSQPWVNYIIGVVDQLKCREHSLSGFDLLISGDIPLGAGLSSSAAVECATAYALTTIFELNISRLDLVKLAQQAEHDFVGVKCGIMDQFASVFGKKDHAIKLDCRSLAYEYIPFTLKNYEIVLLDTQVKHSLASSAYNKRREECEEALECIRNKFPEVKSLRDCSLAMVDDCLKTKNQILHIRAYYIVSEIERVKNGCLNLAANDLHSFGKKMFLTHDGLSNQYEVSCPELDFLIDQVRNNNAVIGARMMGGGFGGCTINLVDKMAVATVVSSLQQTYYEKFSIEMKTYKVSLQDGTSIFPDS